MDKEDELDKREKALISKEKNISEKEGTINETERQSRYKDLASRYEIDAEKLIEAIEEGEDELEAALRLADEAKGSRSVEKYERETPSSVSKKSAWDKTDEEFDKDWDSMKRQAVLKK